MRLLPALVIIMLVFLFYRESFAQSNASNTAKSEKANQMAAGAMGVATGGAMAAYFCSQQPLNGMAMMMCITSLGGAAQSLLTMKNSGKNTDPSIKPLDTTYKGVCETDPKLCEHDTYTFPDYPGLKNDLDNLRTVAKPLGLNIDDPKSIEKFLADHAGDVGGGGAEQAMANLSPTDLAKIEQIKKNVASKFNISSVPLEDGGGGGSFAHRGGRDSSGLDLSKLMGGLNGEKKDDSGLQRKLASGEPIGVASDDIFKIVSRRYQTKIQSKTFLFKR